MFCRLLLSKWASRSNSSQRLISLHLPSVAVDVESFLQRYPDEVVGVLSGLDRIVYRGTFRSIGYVEGMAKWLSSRGAAVEELRALRRVLYAATEARRGKLAEAAGLEVQVHEVHSIVCLISQM